MKDQELRAGGPPLNFDNTMIATYCKCERSLYWFLRRVDTKVTKPYFVFGQAYGIGINTWHDLQGKEDFEPRVAKAILDAENHWDSCNTEGSKNDTRENLSFLIRHYCEQYQAPEAWEVIQSEVGFLFPIQGTPYSYGGALDCYINWPGYGIALREDKTTGAYITDSYIKSWDHQSQITGYLWALWQLTGEEPFGALMNISSKRKRKEVNLQFQRDLQTRSEWKLQNFMQETVLIIEDIQREWDRWSWLKRGERDNVLCTGGAGKSPCPYRRLCLRDQDPWEKEFQEEELEAQGFIIREPWTPWEREGDQ